MKHKHAIKPYEPAAAGRILGNLRPHARTVAIDWLGAKIHQDRRTGSLSSRRHPRVRSRASPRIHRITISPNSPGELEETAPLELVSSASFAELPESEWKMISAEVRNDLLSLRIPPEFRYTNEGLEYCVVNGELRLRPRKLPLGIAARMMVGKR